MYIVVFFFIIHITVTVFLEITMKFKRFHKIHLCQKLCCAPTDWWVQQNESFGVTHCGFTWASKGKGCSPPLVSKSSVLSISDSWSPPPSARPHSLQSPRSAGPPVRITSHLWIFHHVPLEICFKTGHRFRSHFVCVSVCCYFFRLECYMHHPPIKCR